jgi:hypothetical protein
MDLERRTNNKSKLSESSSKALLLLPNPPCVPVAFIPFKYQKARDE